jgi:hypothetical protein
VPASLGRCSAKCQDIRSSPCLTTFCMNRMEHLGLSIICLIRTSALKSEVAITWSKTEWSAARRARECRAHFLHLHAHLAKSFQPCMGFGYIDACMCRVSPAMPRPDTAGLPRRACLVNSHGGPLPAEILACRRLGSLLSAFLSCPACLGRGCPEMLGCLGSSHLSADKSHSACARSMS